jgi:FkbM family methyltransferase
VRSVLALVRHLAQLPGVRRLTTVDAVTRVSFALRGGLVQESARFALNELRARPLAIYHLRGSEIRVALRHRTPDVLVLDEIFAQREYDLPAAVAAVLGRSPRVVDVGANIGLFGAFVLTHFPDASIVAVEADEANAAVHERTIEANGRGDTWQLVHAFAASSPRDVSFAGGRFSTSRAGGETTVEAIDVFPLLADADLVKIDIEGAEWELLADPRFARLSVRALALEYHAAECPGADPRSRAQAYLRGAGFEVHEQARKPQYAAGLFWAWR